MSTCEHRDFWVHADVNRLTDVDGGPVTGYSMDLHVFCRDCNEPFEFIGPPIGLDRRGPRVSFDATELRAPIRPRSAPPGFGLDGPGFTMREPGP